MCKRNLLIGMFQHFTLRCHSKSKYQRPKFKYQLINQDSYWESINSSDICNTCFMTKNILKWHGWAEKRLGDRTSGWDL